MGEVVVGCCGFPCSRKKYFSMFSSVELQQTFYQLPSVEYAKKLRSEAPREFIFTMKCFQGVTHPTTSPTWRRCREDYRGKDYGFLKLNKHVLDAWKRSVEVAEALKAHVILLQLPSSFKETDENVERAVSFLNAVERKNFLIALELRGWSENAIEEICRKCDVIDCCDILVRYPTYLSSNKVAYIRLHGRYEGRRIIYSYKYSPEEIREIKERVESLEARKSFVFFNNSFMLLNAQELINLL